MIQNNLKNPWFHGTDENTFQNWKFPPPLPKNQVVQHSGIFLTPSLEYAKNVGSNVAEVTISENSNILHTIDDINSSEKLRQRLIQKNKFFASTENSKSEYWHSGWQNGAILRPAYADNSLFGKYYLQELIKNSKLYGNEIGRTLTGQQFTRGLIELICAEAKMMGFDGIFGHEIDRWTNKDKVTAQPILCIFNSKSLSQPKWII